MKKLASTSDVSKLTFLVKQAHDNGYFRFSFTPEAILRLSHEQAQDYIKTLEIAKRNGWPL